MTISAVQDCVKKFIGGLLVNSLVLTNKSSQLPTGFPTESTFWHRKTMHGLHKSSKLPNEQFLPGEGVGDCKQRFCHPYTLERKHPPHALEQLSRLLQPTSTLLKRQAQNNSLVGSRCQHEVDQKKYGVAKKPNVAVETRHIQ